MEANSYLSQVLKGQTLGDDSGEMRELRKHRKSVESLLRAKFGSAPHIRYGGSLAKGTMIRESYDLDIPCYFARDETCAGETLEEIYFNVAHALEVEYLVEYKRSALRLACKDLSSRGVYLHIDVIPGRFIDGEKGDIFLHQNEGNKQRLLTNLDVHIAKIGGSGVTDAIRLVKLWKVRNGLQVKTFVLELLVVNLLAAHKTAGLAEQLTIVFTAFRDRINSLVVEDPANPNGNDLAPLLDESHASLSAAAAHTLDVIERSGWESIFGSLGEVTDDEKRKRLQVIASGIAPAARTKPWWPGR